MSNYTRPSTVISTILFVIAIALPSVAQNTDVEGRVIQGSTQEAANIGNGNFSLQQNEQIGIQDLDGNSVNGGSTSVTGGILQQDRQSQINLGNDNIGVQRNRTQSGQNLDGFSFGF